jgi:hypothetical protein
MRASSPLSDRLAFMKDWDFSMDGRFAMATKKILISDLTGKEISDGDAATLTIRYADARRGQVVLDANSDEVKDLAAKGRKQARRGRRPRSSPEK